MFCGRLEFVLDTQDSAPPRQISHNSSELTNQMLPLSCSLAAFQGVFAPLLGKHHFLTTDFSIVR
jgi:hypothetical protein